MSEQSTPTATAPAKPAKFSADPANPPGPRQTSAVHDAAQALLGLGSNVLELTGVKGGREHRQAFSVLCGPTRYHKPAEAYAGVVEKFGGVVSRANAAAVVEALEAAYKECNNPDLFPVDDRRISPEKDAENQAAAKARDAKHAETAARAEVARAAIVAKRPPSAAALIVAELDEDQSDPMTDYFGSKTVRRVAIGWRTGTREDFRQLRRAAQRFEPTRLYGPDYSPCSLSGTYTSGPQANHYFPHHFYPDSLRSPDGGAMQFDRVEDARAALAAAGFVEKPAAEEYAAKRGVTEWHAPEQHVARDGQTGEAMPWLVRIIAREIEHRDNYSMGEGNWVGNNRHSGWKVKSYPLPLSGYVGEIEDGLPADAPETPATDAGGEVPAAGDGYTIAEYTHTKKGTRFALVVLASRVERAEFERLRASAKAAGGWYSRAWQDTPGGFAFETMHDAATWARQAGIGK